MRRRCLLCPKPDRELARDDRSLRFVARGLPPPSRRVFPGDPRVLPFVATVLSAAAVLAMAGARAWRRGVGVARNTSDSCALCGKPWIVDEFGTVDAYLVEGQPVCGTCAPRMRRRAMTVTAAFFAATATSIYFGWVPIVGTIEHFGLLAGLRNLARWDLLMGALSPVVIVASADWALRKMKRDNVLALEALARLRLSTPVGANRLAAGTEPPSSSTR